ncbi:hypothetical protein PYCC9005_002969 [Savitreella phatthalungensis]
MLLGTTLLSLLSIVSAGSLSRRQTTDLVIKAGSASCSIPNKVLQVDKSLLTSASGFGLNGEQTLSFLTLCSKPTGPVYADSKAVVWEVDNVDGVTLAAYGWLAQETSSRALSPCWGDISWKADGEDAWHHC